MTTIFGRPSGLERSATALVAMDKFRGTASARDLVNAVARALESNKYVTDLQPMSDGGEGFREAFAGEEVTVEVPGPLGTLVEARITLDDSLTGRRAVLEIAEVVGREHLMSPTRREALDASSAVVGHLIVGAVALGALSQGADGGVDGGFPTSGDGGAITVPDVPIDVTMPCTTTGGP